MWTQSHIQRHQLNLPLLLNPEYSGTHLTNFLPEHVLFLRSPRSMFSCCAESGGKAVSRFCVWGELINDVGWTMGKDNGCVLVREAAIRSH